MKTAGGIRWGGLLLSPLLLGMIALGPCCNAEVALGSSACFKAVATDVCKGSGGVAGGGLVVMSGDPPCGALLSATFTTFKESDGVQGFSVGDEIITQYSAQGVGPTNMIGVGAFTTASPTNGHLATGWVIQLTTTGNPSNPAFSGDL